MLTPAEYARTLTILDTGRPGDEGFPVHVTTRVLLDGEPVPGCIGVAVRVERHEPTIVELDVLADFIAPPVRWGQEWAQPAIGDQPVLVPYEDIDPATGMGGGWRLVDADPDALPVVRCRFFVASVEIV